MDSAPLKNSLFVQIDPASGDTPPPEKSVTHHATTVSAKKTIKIMFLSVNGF